MDTATPDTLNYLLLGLAAVALIYGALVVSLFVRRRSLLKDLDVLRGLENDDA